MRKGRGQQTKDKGRKTKAARLIRPPYSERIVGDLARRLRPALLGEERLQVAGDGGGEAAGVGGQGVAELLGAGGGGGLVPVAVKSRSWPALRAPVTW